MHRVAALPRRRGYAKACCTRRTRSCAWARTGEFGSEQFDKAKATLERLRAENPDFQSADGHLLYARALEGSATWRPRAAKALIGYYPPGSDVPLALIRQVANARAQSMFADIKRRLDRSPRHVRKMQEEWYAVASRNV